VSTEAAVRSDLETLVAFPTVSSRPITELAAFVAQRCEDLGYAVELFQDPDEAEKCSVIARAGPEVDGGITLSGHLDVVPTEGQPWTSDPFRVVERDGLLYGRGTADMKGFVAATLQGLARIPTADLRRPVALVWTHDEEIGCFGSKKLVDAWLAKGRTLPTSCWIGEPTGFQILRMHKGHVACAVDVTGQAAHSSRPDLGINAIEAAAEVIGHIRAIAAELERERAFEQHFPQPWVPINVATIRGGAAVNIVPDRCTIELGYRPMPGQRPEEVFDRIAARLGDRASNGAKLALTLVRITPSLLTASDTALEALLAPHREGELASAAFATDGGNLARMGLEPLIFGPGRIEVAHQADEHVAWSELVHAVDLVERVVRARCVTPA
jgi:acetylornithine deacetylase